MKKRWIILISIFILFFYINEKRSFYYTEDGKCFTVCKKIGGNCYVAPYKYYGLFKPSDNYVQTTNTACIDFFWTDSLPDNLIVRAVDYRRGFYVKIVNKHPGKVILYNYYDNEEKYEKLFFKSNSYKKDYLNGIDIDIASNRLIRKYISLDKQRKLNNKSK
ncbi:MAG: hypothetical protein LBQ60_05265 [Bacteroidales bacterium]|jgi:hypothetical protein|nr:hypothetical protein [Bacteroidales bacterium]